MTHTAPDGDTRALLTQSRLRMFRACAYKHHLSYVKGWRSARPPLPLRFGTLIHAALETYWSNLNTVGVVAASAMAIQTVRDYPDANPDEDIDAYEQAKALAMIDAYTKRWRNMDADGVEVLGVEQTFWAPMINPRSGSASRTWALAGKLDAIVRTQHDGAIWIIEHKTTSDSLKDGDASNYITRLIMDPQIGHYMTGSLALLYEPAGVIYDVLRKPTQRPLSATPEDKRYKKDGGLRANAREHDETPDEYGERVRAAIEENRDAFLHRKAVVLTEQDLADYADLVWMWADIMREVANKRSPKNPDECDRFGRCHFWDHCAYGFSLEDHPDLWRRAEQTHEEL